MELEIKKFLGIGLIIIGLGIFFWDIKESYYYFTAKKEFPQVFIQSVVNNSANQETSLSTQDQLNALITNQLNQQIQQLLPKNSITELFNLISWSVFAAFLIYAATKLINIGREFWKDSREINQ
ncbi:MAG TPA: hypothetical protein PL093_02000 [Candidatus Pacearchaeota archaeon]|jgi:hypothetical protein|nr:hypothetical protein [Candidatus Pacearchaeota archaeon]HQG09161.1 hypothetical protein [Candidatus Pacearchaeota archaeon]HQH20330.1 hypothetical protein [Candidatus Pacearchaeota archaeon]HQK58650.1 hypothetical protein [Candidatus Pacearchaeota archaeon]HRU20769.1 hypothetical protein [Candidatus Paceibacterota bacterium]